ncbi:MAG: serine protease [Thermoanaerobaculia bacterium]|nr:serine protease [Thermoanaerobaculia bacterium]
MTMTRPAWRAGALVLFLCQAPLHAQAPPKIEPSEREFLETLRGVPKRALLGIQYTPRPEPGDGPQHYRLPVNGLQPGGQGEKAGIKIGDEIVAVDDRPLVFVDPLEIEFFLDPITPGQTVIFRVLRGTEKLDVPVTAAELPPELVKAKQRNRKSLMTVAGVETAEMLGRGAGTPLRIHREPASGGLRVELLENPHRLSALRLAALTVAFEEWSLFAPARQVEPGGAASFRLLYDETTVSFQLEPISAAKTAP